MNSSKCGASDFESATETPRSCSALAGTLADLATVTKVPRAASTVFWNEATSPRTEGRFGRHFTDGHADEFLKEAQQDRLANWHRLQELAVLR